MSLGILPQPYRLAVFSFSFPVITLNLLYYLLLLSLNSGLPTFAWQVFKVVPRKSTAGWGSWHFGGSACVPGFLSLLSCLISGFLSWVSTDGFLCPEQPPPHL